MGGAGLPSCLELSALYTNRYLLIRNPSGSLVQRLGYSLGKLWSLFSLRFNYTK